MWSRTALRLLLIVGVSVSGLSCAVGIALGAVPNANSIACPKAPAGWTTPAGVGGRTVRSPNPLDATPGQNTYLQGTTQVQLLCGYTSPSGELFKVAVNYALPVADYNPYADFDLGCTTKFNTANGDLAWNSKTRRYRVVSLSAWSYAAFFDAYDQLSKSDLAPFERIAQTLLKESLPASHPCSLPGHGKAAAVPPKTWEVEFQALEGVFDIPPPSTEGVTFAPHDWNGAFLTKSKLSGQASDIVGLEFPDFTMSVSSGGCQEAPCTPGSFPPVTRQVATFHFGTNALAFKYTPGSSTMIEVPVTVTSSTYPPCATGSTGTLTLMQLVPLPPLADERPEVVLNACSSANILATTPPGLLTSSDLDIGVLFTAP
jgi:hypothetical protein